MSVKIVSCGSFLPNKIVTNDDLSKVVDTNNEWIVQRTGIEERRIADAHETTSYMAAEALKNAAEKANFDLNTLDAIIVATTTPDKPFPSTACLVQGRLGIKDIFAFDISAACSGFVYAFSIANSFIASGKYKNIAVVGVDKMSSIVDWRDRNTCVLFGDGAGAMILSSADDKSYVIDYNIYANGELECILNIGIEGFIEMNGKEVFKYATKHVTSSVNELLKKNNIKPNELSAVIVHQANARILTYVAETLGISENLFPMTLKKHGNTSAASIPLAFCSIENSIKRGDNIILSGVGAGMTFGSILLKY